MSNTTVNEQMSMITKYPVIREIVDNLKKNSKLDGIICNTDNSNNTIKIVLTHQEINKNCSIEILGRNSNGHVVVALTTNKGRIPYLLNECYDAIVDFYNPNAVCDSIIKHISNFYTVTNIRDNHSAGSHSFQITLAGTLLDVVIKVANAPDASSGSLEKVRFEYKDSRDNMYDANLGLTSFMKTLDMLYGQISSIQKMSNVTSKLASISVSETNRPGTSNYGGVNEVSTPRTGFSAPTRVAPPSATMTPVPVPSSYQHSGISLSGMTTPSNNNSSSTLKSIPTSETKSRISPLLQRRSPPLQRRSPPSSNIDFNAESPDGIIAALSPEDRETLRELHTLDFEQFQNHFGIRSKDLTSFVDSFTGVGIEMTRVLLDIAGLHQKAL